MRLDPEKVQLKVEKKDGGHAQLIGYKDLQKITVNYETDSESYLYIHIIIYFSSNAFSVQCIY